MPDDQPVTQPPTNPSVNDDAGFQKFSEWMARYEREHTPAAPSSGQQQAPQTAQSVEAAVEAALTRRETRQQRDKRLNELESKNGDLAKEVEELKKMIGKGARSVFSIFN
jgi:hypothetical protein